MRNGKQRRAVITGIGPITCIGIGTRRFLARHSGGEKRHPAHLQLRHDRFHAHCAGEIPDWIPEDYFPPHRLKRLDRYAQFAVASARMALDDAGLPYATRNAAASRRRQFRNGARGSRERGISAFAFSEERNARGEPTLALQVFGGSAHSNIAIEFGFRGVGTTNSNSCASGTVAVGEALRYIRDDFADVIVAGGAEAPLSPLTFGAFAIIKTMSQWTGDPPQACRPFDLSATDSSWEKARRRS